MARDGATGSELCIGCIDSSKYTGSITYFPLDPTVTDDTQYYWNTPAKGLFYNGGTSTGAWSAVIDTGTTLFYIPTADAKAFYAKIPGSASAASTVGTGFYTYPCSTDLASITVEFGSTAPFAVNPLDFNLGVLETGSSLCVGGIVGENIDGSTGFLAIVGDEFIKNWYTVFDYGNLRVGFAASV